jgi:hypothetical protein
MSSEHNPQTHRQLESFDPMTLLERRTGGSIDPRQLAQNLATRSRRRTAVLAVVTVLTWIAACGSAIWVVEIYFNEIRPHQPIHEYRYARIHEEIEGKPWRELTDKQRREFSARQRLIDRSNELMMVVTQLSVALFGLAALLSVWLTISSRRTALRQINANLLSITLELAKLLPDTNRSPAQT